MNPELARKLVVTGSPTNPLVDRNGQPMSYLIDTRGALADIELRDEILEQLTAIAVARTCTSIAGVAKSGIAWGAILADRLHLPYATVLPDGPRSSGLRRQVEGDLPPGPCALVDNWVISGGSAAKAFAAINASHGVEPFLLLLMGRSTMDLGFPVVSAFLADEIAKLATD